MCDYYGFTWQMIECHKDSSLFSICCVLDADVILFMVNQSSNQSILALYILATFYLVTNVFVQKYIKMYFFYVGILFFRSPGSDKTGYNKIIIRRLRFKRLEIVLTKSRKKDRKRRI